MNRQEIEQYQYQVGHNQNQSRNSIMMERIMGAMAVEEDAEPRGGEATVSASEADADSSDGDTAMTEEPATPGETAERKALPMKKRKAGLDREDRSALEDEDGKIDAAAVRGVADADGDEGECDSDDEPLKTKGSKKKKKKLKRKRDKGSKEEGSKKTSSKSKKKVKQEEPSSHNKKNAKKVKREDRGPEPDGSALTPQINDVLIDDASGPTSSSSPTVFNHIGNRKFRIFVESNLSSYLDSPGSPEEWAAALLRAGASTGESQSQVVETVINSVRGFVPPGRFLIPAESGSIRTAEPADAAEGEGNEVWRLATDEEVSAKVHSTFLAAGRFHLKTHAAAEAQAMAKAKQEQGGAHDVTDVEAEMDAEGAPNSAPKTNKKTTSEEDMQTEKKLSSSLAKHGFGASTPPEATTDNGTTAEDFVRAIHEASNKHRTGRSGRAVIKGRSAVAALEEALGRTTASGALNSAAALSSAAAVEAIMKVANGMAPAVPEVVGGSEKKKLDKKKAEAAVSAIEKAGEAVRRKSADDIANMTPSGPLATQAPSSDEIAATLSRIRRAGRLPGGDAGEIQSYLPLRNGGKKQGSSGGVEGASAGGEGGGLLPRSISEMYAASPSSSSVAASSATGLLSRPASSGESSEESISPHLAALARHQQATGPPPKRSLSADDLSTAEATIAAAANNLFANSSMPAGGEAVSLACPARVKVFLALPMDKFFEKEEPGADTSAHTVTPTNYDVLCGPGRSAFFHHVGNRRFRVTIELNSARYGRAYLSSVSTMARASFLSSGDGADGNGNTDADGDGNAGLESLIDEMLGSLTKCDPPGRFLGLEMSTGRWRVLNPVYAQLKTEMTFFECLQVKQRRIVREEAKLRQTAMRIEENDWRSRVERERGALLKELEGRMGGMRGSMGGMSQQGRSFSQVSERYSESDGPGGSGLNGLRLGNLGDLGGLSDLQIQAAQELLRRRASTASAEPPLGGADGLGNAALSMMMRRMVDESQVSRRMSQNEATQALLDRIRAAPAAASQQSRRSSLSTEAQRLGSMGMQSVQSRGSNASRESSTSGTGSVSYLDAAAKSQRPAPTPATDQKKKSEERPAKMNDLLDVVGGMMMMSRRASC